MKSFVEILRNRNKGLIYTRRVSALFVDSVRGPYPSMGVDCWDESRNALTYKGTNPVILHPPCNVWCSMARMNERRWGTKVGDDGGMFEFALETLVRCGGVLEHPKASIAWEHFDIPKPKKCWLEIYEDVWTCEVWQSCYGHKANKATWLLYVGDRRLTNLDWRRDKTLATHQVGGGVNTGNRKKQRLSQSETHITPKRFAQVLIELAIRSRIPRAIPPRWVQYIC